MKKRLKLYGFLTAPVGLCFLLYAVWSPGDKTLNDSMNLQNNGIWISHGWFGDGLWFKKYKKNTKDFNENKEKLLLDKIKNLKIKFVYPHLCPADANGKIPGIDMEKIRKFRQKCPSAKVLPWIGGSTESTVDLSSGKWKSEFIKSVAELFSHDEIDGVHINIEPLPTGDPDFIQIISDIKKLKGEKILSIAAYPPPSLLHPHASVHWDLKYYKEVCMLSDQIVPMMYDTALEYKKIYTNLVRQWAQEVIAVSMDKEVLFGIPAYEDQDVGYHHPQVENVFTAMPGIVSAINSSQDARKFSVSIYAEWTLDEK